MRHTRWRHAEGQVQREFRDVLVAAISQPADEVLAALGPWSLADVAPLQPELLSGFDVPRYDRDPADGWQGAKAQMAVVVEQDVRADIGGDVQDINDLTTYDEAVRFGLLLLPLWFATYVTGATTFAVHINANTGEVHGDRPYSKVKIFFAVLAATALVAAFVLLVLSQRS